MGRTNRSLEQEMKVTGGQGAGKTVSGEKKGFEEIKIPTFIQNKKQEG
jgi:hypothetical protein